MFVIYEFVLCDIDGSNLSRCMVLANNGCVMPVQKSGKTDWTRFGQPTEAVITVCAEKFGVKGGASIDSTNVSALGFSRIGELEFTRTRKSTSDIVRPRRPLEGDDNKLFVKGGTEVLIERCSHIELANYKTARSLLAHYKTAIACSTR